MTASLPPSTARCSLALLAVRAHLKLRGFGPSVALARRLAGHRRTTPSAGRPPTSPGSTKAVESFTSERPCDPVESAGPVLRDDPVGSIDSVGRVEPAGHAGSVDPVASTDSVDAVDDDRRRLVDATARGVAVAGALFPGRAVCLEQSLALFVLLRRRGVPAELRIGVQARPFNAHAWVELDGEPVNEDPETVAGFRVLPETAP